MTVLNQGIVWFMAWEESFIVWLQQLGQGTAMQAVLGILNQFFSFLGEEMICIAVMGMVYWGFNKKKGEAIGAAIMIANVGIGMLKNIFSRMRPWASSERIELLRDVDGFSFPSGHSANCTALYPTTAMEYKEKKWLTVLAIAVPLLCGLSRCYVGAHWPTDVIVGLLTGLVIFAGVEFLLPRCKNKYVFYYALIAFSTLGLFYCRTNDYFNSYGMLIGFVFGIKFEEKHTRFENTDKWYIAVIRTAIGAGLYFGLSSLIKIFIGNLFPEESFGWFLMRAVRYGLVVFILIGIYPYAFRLEKKLQRKS